MKYRVTTVRKGNSIVATATLDGKRRQRTLKGESNGTHGHAAAALLQSTGEVFTVERLKGATAKGDDTRQVFEV